MSRGTNRRQALATLGAMALSAGIPALRAQTPVATGLAADPSRLGTRRIPSTGEAMPVIGLGTWITFNVGNDPVARANAAEVMRACGVATLHGPR